MKPINEMSDHERAGGLPPYRWLQIAIVWVGCIGVVAFGGSAITAIVIGIVASIKGVW